MRNRLLQTLVPALLTSLLALAVLSMAAASPAPQYENATRSFEVSNPRPGLSED